MPRVDFYVIEDNRPDARLLLACRLVEKAYRLGHRIYVQAAGREQAQRFDTLLWTFREQSFVPHALCPLPEDDPSPVRIGWDNTLQAQYSEVLINLDHPVPAFFEDFERVVEVVDQRPRVLRESRERFRFYRDKGCVPESHRLQK